MVPIFCPSIKRKDMDAVLTCMVSDKLSNGAVAKSFVSTLAEYLGLSGGIAFREDDRAIGVALESLEIPPGAEVLLSPLSPVAYLNTLERLGLKPLFADVDPRNGTISVSEARKLADRRPAAIIVHYPLGFVPDMDGLLELGIPLLEDITSALGGTRGERKVGSFGRFCIVRSEETDVITTAGGAVLLAAARRDLAIARKSSETLPATVFLPDMNAALGLVQINAVERFIQKRKELAQIYAQSISKSRHKALVQDGESDNTWYAFPVVVETSVKEAVAYARKKGVETIPAFQDTIAARMDSAETAYPNARSLFLRCLLFPLYPSIDKHDASLVSKVLSTLP